MAASDEDMPVFSLEQVAQHRSRQSCWVALHDSVYDFTPFIDDHPGGARGLLRHAGTDASEVFAELHSQSIFAAFGPKCTYSDATTMPSSYMRGREQAIPKRDALTL